jgi:D-arabinose 1-dehydrogenase-like Zn-dependent alcohol dehydrogenase
VEVGPHVTKWKQGDRVGGAWHGGHDGTCRQCNQGLFQMCDNGQINGVTRDGGCKWLNSWLNSWLESVCRTGALL